MPKHHACLFVLAAACTSSPTHHEIKLPPNVGTPQGGNAPVGAFSFGQGPFHYIGNTVPGSASFVDAPVTPADVMPTSSGTGDYNVTLNTTSYAASLMSNGITLAADDGTKYAAVGGYHLYTGSDSQEHVDQVIVLVKQSDFAVGATVAFDGADRLAFFGSGLASAQQPDVFGAAVTGSVTFTAGSLDTMVTANLTGDFGPVDWGGGTGSGSGSGSGGTGSISDGTYTLTIQSPGQAYCDGSLAGHEADFASITAASLAFGGGSVAVTVIGASAIKVEGTPIQSAYATSPLELDPNNGVLAGFTSQSGTGPDATTMVGKYFVVDPGSATTHMIQAGVGAGYGTSDGSGTCTVAFQATLTQ
jgi:hypothetical protein